MNTKFIRKIQIMTALAVLMIVVLLCILIVMVVQNAHYKTMLKELDEKMAYLKTIENDLNSEIEYRNTLEWIEKAARELGMIDSNETFYKPR